MTSSFIELNWLARHDKYILLPVVVFGESKDYGGCWLRPQKGEYLIGGKHYPLDRGLIEVTYHDSDAGIAAVMAHEWRHLWQLYNYGEHKTAKFNHAESISYKERIIDYFVSNIFEWDALLFELKKSPYDPYLEWYEWIIKCKLNY